jgi:hypothetical protein
VDAVYAQLVIIAKGDGTVWAGHNAVPALGDTQAASRVKGQFWLALLRFGVAAPAAGKATALEKNDGSYAGAVVNRILLNIKNHALPLAVVLTHKTILL